MFKTTTFGKLKIGAEFITDGEYGFIKMSPLSHHKPGTGWASVIGTWGSGDFRDAEIVRVWVDDPTKTAPPRPVGDCHYCGMPAYKFGFFDEPVCNQCGG
jgi:hypothetical protein